MAGQERGDLVTPVDEPVDEHWRQGWSLVELDADLVGFGAQCGAVGRGEGGVAAVERLTCGLGGPVGAAAVGPGLTHGFGRVEYARAVGAGVDVWVAALHEPFQAGGIGDDDPGEAGAGSGIRGRR
ncbi:hypothetical protein ACPPVO_43525 [Dactylosporangium sp. McL0621]|uniref:hypothetical protein n=1 Tax=Dactylosporangium sp. McL0621 TaxID=3415678 RepID=UPI003CED9E86